MSRCNGPQWGGCLIALEGARWGSEAMWKRYKDGVSASVAINSVSIKGKKVERPGRGTPYVSDGLYAANKKLDKDRDRLVCEREPKVK